MTRRPRHPPRPGRWAGGLVPGVPVSIVHAKPWKRTVTMQGTVLDWDGALLTVERTFTAGGQYDSLNVPKLAGDWGTIEIPRDGWVLRRAYFRQDGTPIGELYNVQTPAQIRENQVRYVDLEVDVVRWPDGQVAVVDEADLDAAVRAGGIQPAVAERARALAYRLAAILRAGGDWRTADPAGDAATLGHVERARGDDALRDGGTAGRATSTDHERASGDDALGDAQTASGSA